MDINIGQYRNKVSETKKNRRLILILLLAARLLRHIRAAVSVSVLCPPPFSSLNYSFFILFHQ